MISRTLQTSTSHQLSLEPVEVFLANIEAYGVVYENFQRQEQFLLNCRLLKIGKEVRANNRSWTKSDLKEIIQAKSLHPLWSRIERNAPDIDQQLQRALKISEDVERVEGVCKIEGVGPSLASVILTFTFPEVYASLDLHAWNGLRRLGFDLPRRACSGGGFTVAELLRYLAIVRKMGKAANSSTMEVGEALHAFDQVNTGRRWKEYFNRINSTFLDNRALTSSRISYRNSTVESRFQSSGGTLLE